MKKTLLSTTALIALAATGANAGGNPMPANIPAPAHNGGMTVMVGGYVDSQAGIVQQEEDATISDAAGNATASKYNEINFSNDAEIHVTALGQAENFDYGAVIELNATIDGDAEADGNQADKAYVFAESDDVGRIEFGGNEGVSNTLEVDASNIAVATGGIDGDWWQYADLDGIATNGLNDTGLFTTAPNLLIAEDEAEFADANKLTYYTPKFSGLQFGISYTPDAGEVGTAGPNISGNNGNDLEQALAYGVNYEQEVGNGVTLMLGAVGEKGEAESAAANGIEDYTGYSLGGGFKVTDFSFAGNIANQTLTTKTLGDLEVKSVSLGAAYQAGPAGVSLTYLDTETEIGAVSDTLSNIVLGADYQMAPGFTPYAEAAFFEADESGTTVDNEGTVVLLGTEVAF